MKDEDDLLKKKFIELANRSYESSQYIFTDFLSINEQDIFYSVKNEVNFVEFSLFGGIEDCERKMLRFGSCEQLGYDIEFPIDCICIEPLIKKFADDFSHRDFLGAIMNLGIERNVIGDIKVVDNICYVFCVQRMSNYIIENLSRVKHTSVRARIINELPQSIKPKLTKKNIIVSSIRCDLIISKIYNLSRKQSIELFRSKRVFVNDRCYENNSGNLKEDDTVSVRGYGKFRYKNVINHTKKGNINIQIEVFGE